MIKIYKLFVKNFTNENNEISICNNKYIIKVYRPNIRKLYLKEENLNIRNIISRIWLSILSFRKFYIFYVIDETKRKIVHTSIVSSSNIRFRFTNNINDWVIGPCYTIENYRGQNIYPSVLKYITSYHQFENCKFYIFANEKNHSSIKGINKAGFTNDGFIVKDIFRIYKRYEQ